MPKILIGTLFSGENEFERCISSIQTQKSVQFDHFVIKNLPQKEAHKELYSRFDQKKKSYDFLIKIDADMILLRDTALLEIISFFQSHPNIDLLTCTVSDWFTKSNIFGLNSYRSCIDFTKGLACLDNNQSLFTDQIDIEGSKIFVDNKILSPIASHGAHPSEIQAYHYGAHKMAKKWQFSSSNFESRPSQHHSKILSQILAHYISSPFNKKLQLALLGAIDSYNYQFTLKDLDYNNPQFRNHFFLAQKISSQDRYSKISHFIKPHNRLYREKKLASQKFIKKLWVSLKKRLP